MAAEKRFGPQWPGRTVWNFVSGLLLVGRNDRRSSGAESRFAASAGGRLVLRRLFAQWRLLPGSCLSVDRHERDRAAQADDRRPAAAGLSDVRWLQAVSGSGQHGGRDQK